MYISATGNISPQKTFGHQPLVDVVEYTGNRLACIEPDYKDFIDPKQIRRMSRIIRMGVAAAMECLQEAGVKVPDAIVTGTAYGCLEDTNSFLSKMVEFKEELLTPTSFIQSTHNTIGAQIGLILQCNNYNNAFVHRGFSFESALLDAMMWLKESPSKILLTGGVDEITDVSLKIQKRFGFFRETSASSMDLFNFSTNGTLRGEGAFYFALSGKRGKESYSSIDSISTFYNPTREELITGIHEFIQSASVTTEELDLVLIGKCGDADLDQTTEEISKQSFGAAPIGLFKHLSGEYPTASAFALWLGARIIQTQQIPPTVLTENIRPVKNILIYNPYFGHYHSLILLRAC